MQIIGYKRANFKANDGKEITGYNVFVGTEINPATGAGMSVERTYFSDSKLAKCGVQLEELMGREVRIYYNRFGKPESIAVAD